MNYRGHKLSALLFLLFFIPIFIKTTSWLGLSPSWNYLVVFAFGHYFCTVMLSPDLDVYSQPFKNWGALRGLWVPYQRVYKHRGGSHTLTGSVVRMAYFGVFLVVVLLALGAGLGGMASFVARNLWYVVVFLMAGLVASLQHILMDKTSSAWKRQK